MNTNVRYCLLCLAFTVLAVNGETVCQSSYFATMQMVSLDTAGKYFAIDDCSYPQGLQLTTASSALIGATISITKTSISGVLDIRISLSQGSSLTISGLRGVTTAPTLSIVGSLVYSSSLSITDSSLAVVTAALTLSNCATVTILRSSMTQLALPATSASLAASSSFLIHSSSVVAVSGQLDAIRVACAMVDSVFELWNSTVIGDIQAGITFNSSAITAIPKQGTNNLINFTGNTLVLRSTTATINTGSVIKQFVLGFTAPPSVSSTACYLRSGTQLTLSGNTLTSFAPNSNLPLMYIYSLGALVAHDGSNKGTGGRLEFVSDGKQSVVGPQLAIRRYTALLSITLTVLAPLDNLTFWVDNCTTGTLSIFGSSQLLTRANVFFANSLATSQFVFTKFLNSTIAFDNVTVQTGVVAINTAVLTNTTMDIRRCVALGISAAGLVMSSSIISIRENKATSYGVGLDGSASSSSTVYIDNNTITSTTASALSIGMTVNAGCFVALIRNRLSGSSSGNGIIWTGASYNSSLLVSQNSAVGDYFHSGNVQGPQAFLNLSGNVFSPLPGSSSIFTVSNLRDGARLCVDDSNRFLGGKAFSVTLPLTKATTVPETVRVYLSLLSSVLGSFTFSGVPNAVANNYSGSVIAIRSTPIGGAVTISLPYANGVNVLLRDAPISGSLSFAATSAQNVYFICESSTTAKVTVTGAITISGSLASSSVIVLNGIQNGVGITASFSSSCPSKAASCLFAIWNCDVLTNNVPLSFSGAVGSFTHIDLYRSSLNSNDNPGVHTVTFASGAPSSSASISVIEMDILCANTGVWDEDAFPIHIPSSSMSGGFEIWGSYLFGDHFTATWTNGNMKFFWAFSNYIKQGDYSGAGRNPSNGQGGTACNDGDSTFLGGGDIAGVPSVSCTSSVTKLRCTHDSQFSKAPYSQAVTISVVGSCMVLPTLDTALSIANVPTISGLSFMGTQFNVKAIIGKELSSMLSVVSCESRRLRTLSLKLLWVGDSTNFQLCGVHLSPDIWITVYRYTTERHRCFFTQPLTASLSMVLSSSTSNTQSMNRFPTFTFEERTFSATVIPITGTPMHHTKSEPLKQSSSNVAQMSPSVLRSLSHPQIAKTLSSSVRRPWPFVLAKTPSSSKSLTPVDYTNTRIISTSMILERTRTGRRRAERTRVTISQIWPERTRTPNGTHDFAPPILSGVPATTRPVMPLADNTNKVIDGVTFSAGAVADPFGVIQLDAVSSIIEMASCSDGTILSDQDNRPYDFGNNPFYLFIGPDSGAADRGTLVTCLIILIISLASPFLIYSVWQIHLYFRGAAKTSPKFQIILGQFPSILITPAVFIMRLAVWSSVRLLCFSEYGYDYAFSSIALVAVASYCGYLYYVTLFKVPSLVKCNPTVFPKYLRGIKRNLAEWIWIRTAWEVVRLKDAAPMKANPQTNESELINMDTMEPMLEVDPSFASSTSFNIRSEVQPSFEEQAVVWLNRNGHYINRVRDHAWFISFHLTVTILLKILAAASTRTSCVARNVLAFLILCTFVVIIANRQPLPSKAKLYISFISNVLLALSALLNTINAFLENKSLAVASVSLSMAALILGILDTFLTLLRVCLKRPPTVLEQKRHNESNDDTVLENLTFSFDDLKLEQTELPIMPSLENDSKEELFEINPQLETIISQTTDSSSSSSSSLSTSNSSLFFHSSRNNRSFAGPEVDRDEQAVVQEVLSSLFLWEANNTI